MSPGRLDELLERLPDLTIGLLGDLFLDRYLELQLDASERSIETGLEAYQVERIRNAPGALGTVINNLAALGVGRLLPVTVIGDDGHGFDLLRELPAAVDRRHILQCPARLTPTYTKPLRPRRRDGAPDLVWDELQRLDVRTRQPLTAETQALLERRLAEAWSGCDGWIVLDQIAAPDRGVVNRAVRQRLSGLASAEPPGSRPVLVDSRSQLAHFASGQLKGNRAEILAAAGVADASAEADAGSNAGSDAGSAVLCDAIMSLQRRRGQQVFCTDGPRGIWIGGDRGAERVPAPPVTGPIDIVGAGDAATAGLICGQLAGGQLREAAELANLAAAVTIRQLGATGVARADWLREEIRRSG